MSFFTLSRSTSIALWFWEKEGDCKRKNNTRNKYPNLILKVMVPKKNWAPY